VLPVSSGKGKDMRRYGNFGLSLIELLVALSLLSVALAVGFGFYEFVHASFVRGEQQANLQQAVGFAADYLNDELRNVTDIELINAATIPAVSQIPINEYYIYLNAGNALELRKQGASSILIDFDDYKVSGATLIFRRVSPTILAFTLSADRKTAPFGRFTVTTEIFLDNLPLSGKVISGPPDGGAVRFAR